MTKPQYIHDAYQRATNQRYLALKNAFETIHIFAIHSLNPELFEKYEEVKDKLLTVYGNDCDEAIIIYMK